MKLEGGDSLEHVYFPENEPLAVYKEKEVHLNRLKMAKQGRQRNKNKGIIIKGGFIDMANNIPTPHISAKEGEIAPSILLPGDPLRAKIHCRKLPGRSKTVQFYQKHVRVHRSFYRDKPISVMGAGMGCASMGIYSHELMNFYGVKKLVRVGTAGAMQKTTHIRDLVLSHGRMHRHRLCKGAGASRRLFLHR